MDKINFKNGSLPAINDTNLNLMQTNIENAINVIDNKITNATTYSTEEINTVKKWIDGKDVYSKTYTGECNSGSSQTIANSLKDIDTVIKIEGTFQRKSDKLASPIGAFYSTSGGQSRALWQGTKKELIIEKDASIWNTNFEFIVTVEYTKQEA